MNVTSLKIQNIGIIGDIDISINKPEIVFYGDIKQGKSTLLNAVRWAFGGSFPADILRHGQTEAFVQIEGEDRDVPWCIRREWYRGRDGVTRAREIVYTKRGVPVKRPVAEIQRHLNPFLIDQDYLRKMSTLERSRYLLELFGVDTSECDAIIKDSERKAAELRVKIKAYGNIDLTPVAPVDTESLVSRREAILEVHAKSIARARSELAVIKHNHAQNLAGVISENERRRAANEQRADKLRERAQLVYQIGVLTTQLKQVDLYLSDSIEAELLEVPSEPDLSEYERILQTAPDTADIDAEIRDAGATNVRAEQYARNKARAAERASDEESLSEHERTIREHRKAKLDMLANIGRETGIEGLEFTETGAFKFDGADSSMLSDSQLMRLSQSLSTKYPEGFGLSMIDRGESLGKTVLTLWEEAQQREATVLVTVVGDKPAVIPEQVGAYVVEEGNLKQ